MIRTKIKCELCGREISKSNFTRHLETHENGNFDKWVNQIRLDHNNLFCKYCGKEYKNKKSLVQHEIRCKENPDKINVIVEGFNKRGRIAWNRGLTKETDERLRKSSETFKQNIKYGKTIIKGHPHTEETKRKISEKRKKYLLENPDKVPYLLNHSSKISYPEKYFIKLFKEENINLQHHYRIHTYELDFCNLDKKIDLEIDGEQHYLDKKIQISDIKRNEYLKNLGWTIKRIRWSNYQKLTIEEKKLVINSIKELLNDKSPSDLIG